jgi:hypothetical protein
MGPPVSPAGGSGISWKAIAIALLVVIVGLGAVVAVVASGDDEAEAEEITLEPVATAGTNPFMTSVGTDDADVPPPPDSGGTFAGNTAGLYGGTLNNASCNATQLVTFLQQNPDKAAVWAGVLGISPVEIETYVDGLTPVLLRADVAVTNHGFANGRATVIPAILQSGTAVLVDKYGFPVVKCYCGNPLTRPRVYTSPTYTGSRWRWFNPTSITIIQQTTIVINDFTLVDPRTGDSFTRPAGTDGTADQPTTPAPEPEPVPEPVPEPQPEPVPEPEPPGPTAEERAAAKVDAASQACYPFPAPIEDSTGSTKSFENTGPNTFVLQVATDSPSGQIFRWEVDRTTLAFTPINDLAQAASNHCADLN